MDCARLDPATAPESKNTVRVWLLLGKYAGDNAQVLGLGDHLAATFGWRCETRQIRFHRSDQVPREKLPDAIDWARSDSFDPPFPDVFITCGRFYGAVAAWLKAKAGGRPLHVHFGRIAAPMTDFDLIGGTAQYGLPAAPNFMPLTLPFVRHNPARTEASLAAWRGRFAALPRPLTAVLVGGPQSRMRFDAAEARALLNDARTRTRATGGALAVAFGRRTPAPVRAIIAEGLAISGLAHVVSDWPAPEPNPYPALLALADRFLVTSDSASMIADACVTGRAVDLHRLPVAPFVRRISSRGFGLSIDTRRRLRDRAGRTADPLDRLRDLLVARYWMRPWDEALDFLAALDRARLVDCGVTDRGRTIQAQELGAFGARVAALAAARRRGAEPERPAFSAALFAAAD